MAKPGFTWDASDPLARCDGETLNAWAALNDYARMGPGRSLDGLYNRYKSEIEAGATPKPPSRRRATLLDWSAAHAWQERVAAFDERHQAELNEKWAERRLQLREQDWDQGEQLRQAAAELIDGLELFKVVSDDYEEDENGEKIRVIRYAYKPSIGDVTRAIKDASALQRLAAEAPTDRVELTGAALDALIERLLRQRAEGDDEADGD